ncbi:MAG: taurine ABC transporter substrate-binding protein [Gaiellaceae bacterium]
MSDTSPTTRRRRRVRPALLAGAVAAALITTVVLVGCGSSSKDSSGSAPSQIRIAYQLIPNGDLIVKDKKWLEEALPDTNIKWLEFASGADVNTAVIAGSVDIGLAGSSPVAKGIAIGTEYKVPWIFDVIGKAESLVASNDSGVKSIADLAGKKVATPFGSTAHYSLLAALEGAGVDPTTVKIIDLEPQDILAAWERGDIDAAYVWNPTLASLIKNGTVLITSADLAKQGKLTADLAVVTTSFADKYPDAVQTWLDQETRAVELFRSNPDDASAAIARQLNITPAEALDQADQLIFLNASEQAGADYLGTPDAPGALAGNLQSAAEFLKQQGQVDTVPPLATFEDGLANQFVVKASGK